MASLGVRDVGMHCGFKSGILRPQTAIDLDLPCFSSYLHPHWGFQNETIRLLKDRVINSDRIKICKGKDGIGKAFGLSITDDNLFQTTTGVDLGLPHTDSSSFT